MSNERYWRELARVDALWAILSDPAKRGGGWDLTDFLGTGVGAAEAVRAKMRALGLPLRRASLLDFGSGVGRVTGPLSEGFGHSLGLDVSPEMVARARQIWEGRPGLEFGLLGDCGLKGLPERRFDLVHSFLVLQHLSSRRRIRKTLAELARLLAPGGLLVLQLPSRIPLRKRLQVRGRLYRAGRAVGCRPRRLLRLGLDPISMRSLPEAEVVEILAEAGCVVLEAVRDGSAGPGIESLTYFATRRPA